VLHQPQNKLFRPPREKRKSRRHPMRRAAEVVFSEHMPPARCVIWDMSDGGARIAVALPLADLPSSFALVLYKDGSIRRNCEVVWMDARYVGVRFI
jgi:hypothetical protein